MRREKEVSQFGDALLFKKFKAVNIEALSANVQLVASAERIAALMAILYSPFALLRSPLS